jgi:HD superfamily phosphohydrolase YqeK
MTATALPTSAAAAALDAARAGRLPEWAAAGPERQAHIARVAALMDEWAAALRVSDAERERWRAAAWLHDALRDAPADALRATLEPPFDDLPDAVLHGPAAARRLEHDGAADAELLDAVRFHTIGHPGLGRAGRMLYLADFLEPGRDFAAAWRSALRARMPNDADAVLRDVLRARIEHLLRKDKPVRAETVAFWNSMAAAAPDA